jgi:hypothetical protein
VDGPPCTLLVGPGSDSGGHSLLPVLAQVLIIIPRGAPLTGWDLRLPVVVYLQRSFNLLGRV